MINNVLRTQYETRLLNDPNGILVFFLLLFIFIVVSFFGGFLIVIRLFRLVGTFHKQPPRIHFGKKISIERFVLTVRAFLLLVDVMEQRVLKKIQEIVDRVAREVLVSNHERDR